MTTSQENRLVAKTLLLVGLVFIAAGLFCVFFIPNGGVGLVIFGLTGWVVCGAGMMIYATEDEWERRNG